MKTGWLVFALLLWAGIGYAQQREVVQSIEVGPDHEAIVVPKVSDVTTGIWQFGDTTIAIERQQNRVLYQASEGRHTREQWVSTEFEDFRFVYDKKSRTFKRIMPSLRVELDDFTALEGLTKKVGGTSSRGYPQLGYAIINLQRSADPVEVSENLRIQPGVKSATIMLEMPRNIPM